jgi:predicted enzyme related to lactoylglutathione lyase
MGNAVVHFEIHGSNAEKLGKFYSELFGWQTQYIPEMSYVTVDTASGAGINGGIGDNAEAQAKVTVYVEAPDLDAKLKEIEALGGKTVTAPTEIPNIVTFALFQDPQGNVVGLVKALEPGQEAPGVSPGSNTPLDWFEIYGSDPKSLKDFYSKAFDWKVETSDDGGMEYNHFDTGAGRGIHGAVTADPSGTNKVVLWGNVDDVAKFQQRAEELGAEIAMPPMKVSDNMEVGIIKDPDENLFGLYRRGEES